jgi:hypothetical protein
MNVQTSGRGAPTYGGPSRPPGVSPNYKGKNPIPGFVHPNQGMNGGHGTPSQHGSGGHGRGHGTGRGQPDHGSGRWTHGQLGEHDNG